MRKINIGNNGLVNSTDYGVDGTCLQGTINTNYSELVRIFGKQNSDNDSGKIDAQWTVNTPDGIATIYNYKDGKSYLGKDGLRITDITDWHIGGKNKKVIDWIKLAILKN